MPVRRAVRGCTRGFPLRRRTGWPSDVMTLALSGSAANMQHEFLRGLVDDHGPGQDQAVSAAEQVGQADRERADGDGRQVRHSRAVGRVDRGTGPLRTSCLLRWVRDLPFGLAGPGDGRPPGPALITASAGILVPLMSGPLTRPGPCRTGQARPPRRGTGA